MRRVLAAAAFVFVGFAAEKPEWDNPAILHTGTERPHATMMAFPSAELAKTGDRAR